MSGLAITMPIVPSHCYRGARRRFTVVWLLTMEQHELRRGGHGPIVPSYHLIPTPSPACHHTTGEIGPKTYSSHPTECLLSLFQLTTKPSTIFLSTLFSFFSSVTVSMCDHWNTKSYTAQGTKEKLLPGPGPVQPWPIETNFKRFLHD